MSSDLTKIEMYYEKYLQQLEILEITLNNQKFESTYHKLESMIQAVLKNYQDEPEIIDLTLKTQKEIQKLREKELEILKKYS